MGLIRSYKKEDLPELLDAWYTASLVVHPFLTEEFFEQERKDIQEIYMPKAETYVYELDGQVVGYIALLGNEVGAIFVHSDFQGKGIGKKLMDYAKNIREYLVLDVFKKNKIGRAFYDKYGFKQIDEHIHEETGNVLLRLELRN